MKIPKFPSYLYTPLPCLCGSNRSLTLAHKDRYKNKLNTKLCLACGLLRSDPYLHKPSIASFYKHQYQKYYHPDYSPQTVEANNLITSYILPKISLSPSDLIFDIGCGSGVLVSAFRHHGYQAYGCDFQPRNSRHPSKYILPGDENSLKKHGQAKLIILNHVLEHSREPRKFIRVISQLLVPSGYLAIFVPGVFNIHRDYPKFGSYLQIAHAFHYSQETLLALLTPAGFTTLDSDQVIRSLFIHHSSTPYKPSKLLGFKTIIYISLLPLVKMADSLIQNSMAFIVTKVKNHPFMYNRLKLAYELIFPRPPSSSC